MTPSSRSATAAYSTALATKRQCATLASSAVAPERKAEASPARRAQ